MTTIGGTGDAGPGAALAATMLDVGWEAPGQSYGHVTGSSGDYDFMLVKSLGTSKITGGLAATSA